MSIKVFLISGSAPAWRVLLALEFKQLDYDTRVLETSKREQKEAWFLEISPRGQVPVLQHGDVTVSESLAIMQYLDAAFPQPPIFGQSPAETAAVAQGAQEILSYTDRAFNHFVQPVFRGRADENREDIVARSDEIHAELAMLEDRIRDSGWLGDTYGGMDIVLTPSMQRLKRAIAKCPELAEDCGLGELASRYPALVAWDRKVEALPAFAATFPPHWR